MDLPRWQQKQVSSGQAGIALASPQELARPLEAQRILGDVITDEGARWAFKLDNMIANNQLGQFQLDAEQMISETDLGDDPLQYLDKYNASLGKVKTELLSKITHNQAKQQAELWLGSRDLDWQESVKGQAQRVTTQKASDLYIAARKTAVETGNVEMLTSATQRAIESGLFDLEVGQLNLEYDLTKIQEMQKASLTAGYKNAISQLVQTNQPDLVDSFIDKLSVEPAEKTELKQYANTTKNTYEVSNRSAYDGAVAKMDKDFTQKMLGGTLTLDEIYATPADVPDEYARDMKNFRDDWATTFRQYIEAKAKKDPNLEDDPIVYSNLWNRIRKINEPGNTDGINDIQILKFMGKGISEKSSRELITFLDEQKQFKYTQQQNRALAVMDRLRETNISLIKSDTSLSDEEKSRKVINSEMTYNRISNDYIQWVKANPNATDDQLETKLSAMMRPVEQDITIGFINSALYRKQKSGITEIGFPFRKTEEDILVQKKIDRLIELNRWNDLSDNDKKSAEEYFKQGKTVEDILKMLDEARNARLANTTK